MVNAQIYNLHITAVLSGQFVKYPVSPWPEECTSVGLLKAFVNVS